MNWIELNELEVVYTKTVNLDMYQLIKKEYMSFQLVHWTILVNIQFIEISNEQLIDT